MCLEMGAVEILIVWESLDCDRYEMLNPSSSKIEVKFLTSEQVRADVEHEGADVEHAGAGLQRGAACGRLAMHVHMGGLCGVLFPAGLGQVSCIGAGLPVSEGGPPRCDGPICKSITLCQEARSLHTPASLLPVCHFKSLSQGL